MGFDVPDAGSLPTAFRIAFMRDRARVDNAQIGRLFISSITIEARSSNP